MLKRGFDIVIAGVGLITLSPLFLAIALAVKLETPGPAFFKQKRVGLFGRSFMIYKFRTMAYIAKGSQPNVSARGDERVTRVGALLRATFLDELPQLLNVVKGEMSMVGPRPETPEHVALYSDEQRRVLQAKPGMAGPSALAFWNEADILAAHEDPYHYYLTCLMHERVQLDLQYADQCSFLYDLKMLAKTLRVIVVRG